MPMAFFNFVSRWFDQHREIAWSLIGFSAAMFVVALVALPFVVVRIPADYFAHNRPPALPWQKAHPALRIAALAAKNLLGAVLLIVGLVMLITPGQGVLCILLGLAMLDVPGKRKIERWIVTRPAVFKALNALRKKYGKPPLKKPS
jgi:hypothetical protein